MSATIWQTKWCQKFLSLGAQFKLPQTLRNTLAEQQLKVQKCRQLLPYIHVCEREARELGLARPDLGEIRKDPRHIAYALCALIANRVTVNECVEYWKDAKNNKLVGGAVRWADYPVSLRREINDILEIVRIEEEGGYWVVDEEAKKLKKLISDVCDSLDRGEYNFGAVPKKAEAAGH